MTVTVSGEVLFPDSWGIPSLWPLLGVGETKLAMCGIFYKGTNPTSEDTVLTMRPNHSGPFPNMITLGMMVLILETLRHRDHSKYK